MRVEFPPCNSRRAKRNVFRARLTWLLADIGDIGNGLRDLAPSRHHRLRAQFGAPRGHAAGALQLLLRDPGQDQSAGDRVHRARLRRIRVGAAAHARRGGPRDGELFALPPQGGQCRAEAVAKHVMRLLMVRMMGVVMLRLQVANGGRLQGGRRALGPRAAVLGRRRVHRVLGTRSAWKGGNNVFVYPLESDRRDRRVRA